MTRILICGVFCCLFLLGASLSVLFLGACQEPPVRQEQPLPPATLPEKIQLESKIPSIALAEETPAEQVKSTVKIIVSMVPFEKKIVYVEKVKKIQSRDGRIKPERYEVKDYIETPTLTTAPDHVSFKIAFYNQGNRIIRLISSVVQYQLDGQNVALEKKGYEEFMNGIILPHQSSEFKIDGPSIDSLPIKEKDNFVVGIFFYDIPIETDEAGNPTKRENFQWYFTCKNEKVQATAETKVTRKIEDTMPGACKTCDGLGSWKHQGCNGGCSLCQGGKEYCPTCKGTGKN
jgi:hypothetical protein